MAGVGASRDDARDNALADRLVALANGERDFSSIATGFIGSTGSSALSPGITISDPSLNVTVPVTLLIRK
jgi:hypothetical protein